MRHAGDDVALRSELDSLGRRELVRAVLRRDDGLAGAQDLLVPFLLLAGGLGAEGGSFPVVVEALWRKAIKKCRKGAISDCVPSRRAQSRDACAAAKGNVRARSGIRR